MNRRHIVIVGLVVALVGLSGCLSALPFNNSGTGEFQDVNYPAGASADGVNATLANTHQQMLSGTSYHLMQTQTQSVADRTVEQEVQVSVDANDSQLLITSTRAGVESVSYFNNSTAYTQVTRNETTNYSVQQVNRSFSFFQQRFTATNTISALLQQGNYEVTDVSNENGITYITYNLTGIENRRTGEVNSDGVSGELVIDTEGRIHSLEMTRERQTGSVTIDLEFSEIGSASVNEPSWTEQAEQSQGNTTATNSTATNSTAE